MASGFSYTAGRSRCFSYWQEFSKCYAQADAPSQCKGQVEDYMECLHRTKEIARAQEVKAEFVKQAKKHAHNRTTTDILSDGVIVGVGLIQRDH